MRLIVFHYHFLPGGVTQVVTSSAIAALIFLPDIDGITLVSGKEDNIEKVKADIKSKLLSNSAGTLDIASVVLPEIDYISDMGKYPDTVNLKETLVEHFKGNLWWIHNYHLGKNPFFTKAVLQIAKSSPEQKIVLQIHDFPEASRYKNLEILRKYIKGTLYPVYQNIRYVTINSRDKAYLIDAGIPKEMVFLLNNPIEPLQREKGNTHFDRLSTALSNRRKETRGKIDKILSELEPSYIKGAPLMVYPVRTIRRKNVLEAGLLAKCSIVPVNLLPTLPGVSNTERGYSNIVDSCFNKELIPGAPQAGIVLADKGVSFFDIMDAGKIIISSSVQEGFGYLFINSLQWGKPLLARKLDVISDFSNIFSTEFSYFYESVNIPLQTALFKQLKQNYDRKISELEGFLDGKIVLTLKEQNKQVLQDGYIDFSYLSPVMQRNFLKDLKDPGLLSETRKLNNLKLEQMETMLSINTVTFDETSIEKFSLSKHAEQIGNIISSLNFEIKVSNVHKKNIDRYVSSYFASFDSIRLLHDPF